MVNTRVCICHSCRATVKHPIAGRVAISRDTIVKKLGQQAFMIVTPERSYQLRCDDLQVSVPTAYRFAIKFLLLVRLNFSM